MADACDNTWPRGFSCHIEFDFFTAFEAIGDQLGPEFPEPDLAAALRIIFKECYDKLMECPERLSYLVVQITFLDIAWERLLGLAKGPSPWKPMRGCLETNVIPDPPRQFSDIDEMLSVSSGDTPDDEVLVYFHTGFDTYEFYASRIAVESPDYLGKVFRHPTA